MSEHTINPLYDKVVLQEVEEETKRGNLILAEGTEASKRAKVIAVGEGVKNARKGDLVLFERQATTSAIINEQDYLICRETDLYLILGNEGN